MTRSPSSSSYKSQKSPGRVSHKIQATKSCKRRLELSYDRGSHTKRADTFWKDKNRRHTEMKSSIIAQRQNNKMHRNGYAKGVNEHYTDGEDSGDLEVLSRDSSREFYRSKRRRLNTNTRSKSRSYRKSSSKLSKKHLREDSHRTLKHQNGKTDRKSHCNSYHKRKETESRHRSRQSSFSASSTSNLSDPNDSQRNGSRGVWKKTKCYSTELKDDSAGYLSCRRGDYLIDRYKIRKVLGEGAFGRCMECWDRNYDRTVAVKIIKNVEKYRDAAELEIRVLKKIIEKDPNRKSLCIHLIDWFNLSGHICLIFEKLGKSVFQYLKENKYRPYPLNQIRHISYQLLSAVKFMHSIKLIHTDLKPENMLFINSDYESLLSAEGVDKMTANPPYSMRRNLSSDHHRKSNTNDSCSSSDEPTKSNEKSRSMPYRCLLNSEIRVIDFGSATFEWEHHSSTVGTRHYRAPEVILGLGWSYPCDLWSVGCIIFELYHGRPLYMTHDSKEHLMMMQKSVGYFPSNMIRGSGKKFFDGEGNVKFGREFGDSDSAVKEIRVLEDYCEYDCDKKQLKGKFTRKFESNISKSFPTSDKILSESDLHQAFFHLIRSLLQLHPDKRATARDAIKHPFFTGLCCSFNEK